MSSVSLAQRKRATRNSNKGSTSYSDADAVHDYYTTGPYDKNDANIVKKKNKIDNDTAQAPNPSTMMDDIQPIVPTEIPDLQSHDQPVATSPTPINNDKGKLPSTVDQHPPGNQSKTSTINFDTIQVIDDQFKDKKTSFTTVHELFIPKRELPFSESNTDLENRIRAAFVSGNFASKVYTRTQYSFTYFVIQFKTKEYKDSFLNKRHPLLRAYLYDYTESQIDAHINNYLASQDTNIIKLHDIPFNFDVKVVIQHLANRTKRAIKSYKVMTPSSPLRFNRSQRSNNRRQNYPAPRPQFKQLIVHFTEQSSVEYIYQAEIWSLEIENFVVRILPGNPKHAEYIKRTKCQFKIAGLPLNTLPSDLGPIVKFIKGRTCSFGQTNRSSTTKIAFIQVDPKDYPAPEQNGI